MKVVIIGIFVVANSSIDELIILTWTYANSHNKRKLKYRREPYFSVAFLLDYCEAKRLLVLVVYVNGVPP